MDKRFTVLAKDGHKYKPLSRDEESVLTKLTKRGSIEAINKLVLHNINFAAKVAKQYEGQGLDVDDLIQYACIGLIKAAHRFDEKKNFRFITYAVWWIRQSILMAISEYGRITRLPNHISQLISSARKAKTLLEIKKNRVITADEVAEHLNVKSDDVELALAICDDHCSLNTPKYEGDETKIDYLAIEDDHDDSYLKLRIREAIESLPVRQRRIIEAYHGFVNDGCCSTLEELGEEFSMTRERVRQINKNAKRELARKLGRIVHA